MECRLLLQVPAGVRGSAHTVVRASKYGIDDEYLANYEEDLLIMCQVESEEGVKKIDEIAAVDGVDCIQMGPRDLSASLGYLWDLGHKKVREVLRGAEKVVLVSADKKNGGAYLSGIATPHDRPEQLKMRGYNYNMVSGGVDVGLFRNAVLEDVKKFKMGLANGSWSEDEEDKPKGEKYWSEGWKKNGGTCDASHRNHPVNRFRTTLGARYNFATNIHLACRSSSFPSFNF